MYVAQTTTRAKNVRSAATAQISRYQQNTWTDAKAHVWHVKSLGYIQTVMFVSFLLRLVTKTPKVIDVMYAVSLNLVRFGSILRKMVIANTILFVNSVVITTWLL